MAGSYRSPQHDAVTSRVRLRDHDYASPGTYFITSCIEQRLCLLGDVVDGTVRLSPAGKMVEWWWRHIEERFPEVVLDAWTIMPNHLHGIIVICAGEDGMPLPDSPSIPAIMHWFRTKTTNAYIDGVNHDAWPRYPKRLWQARYIDHIVRSERALEHIRAYIEANPSNWPSDEENARR